MRVPLSLDMLKEAVSIVAAGGLVVFPTDTVYGVGCDPFNPAAMQAIYKAKGRDAQKALPLLLSSHEELQRFALDLSPDAELLSQLFWPGALTLVLRRVPSLPDDIGQGDTVALRVPAHEEARLLLSLCGGALATTSANGSGMPDAFTATQAEAYLGKSVSLIIDGGTTAGNTPSTVVDCTVSPPRILREGKLAGEIAVMIRQSSHSPG